MQNCSKIGLMIWVETVGDIKETIKDLNTTLDKFSAVFVASNDMVGFD